ncbi:MAG: TetR/AcrR family transcriptional regulator [Micropruina sp.]|nr:TetR/AcrR family transcriptional regulator [Micropruina sp.]
MVARIDPRERRRDIVRAAFRLVVAEGVAGMSLRKVAAESGLNIGSVRHYFRGHDELLIAAAEEAGDRMGRRLAGHPVEALRGLAGDAARDALQELVEAVLPMDEERRLEAIVVTELIVASRTRPVFAPSAERMGVDLRQVIAAALEALGVPDPAGRAAGLTAVIGGLTLDALTPHGRLAPERLRAILRQHLRLILHESHGVL